VRVFEAIRIILAPAITPLIQLIAVLVLAISLCLVLIGFSSRPARDHIGTRYVVGAWQVAALSEAVERYRADCGEYPSAREGFNVLVDDPGVEGWSGPYLKQKAPLDPWGRPYIYLRSAGSAPEILSYGADGKPGGEGIEADISSRYPWRTIPHNPHEVRTRHIWIGVWIGGWLGLIGSLFVLIRTSRRAPAL